MASGNLEDEVCKKALDKCNVDLVNDMNAKDVLDYCIQYNVIPATKCRDIQSVQGVLEAEKNRMVLREIRTRGPKVYKKFKKCLRESYQGHLADNLEEQEIKIMAETGARKSKKGQKLPLPQTTTNISGSTNIQIGDNNTMVVKLPGPEQGVVRRSEYGGQSTSQNRNRPASSTRGTSGQKNRPASDTRGTSEQRNRPAIGTSGPSEQSSRPASGTTNTYEQRNRPASGTTNTSEQIHRQESAPTGPSEQSNRQASGITNISQQIDRKVGGTANSSQPQINNSTVGSQMGHAGQTILNSNMNATGRESRTTDKSHAGDNILRTNVEKMYSSPALPSTSTVVNTRVGPYEASVDTDDMSVPNEYLLKTEHKYQGGAEQPSSSNLNNNEVPDNDKAFGKTSVLTPDNSLAQDMSSKLGIDDKRGTDEVDRSQRTSLAPHPGRIVNMEAKEIREKLGQELKKNWKKGGFGKIYKTCDPQDQKDKRYLFGLKRDIIVKKINVNKGTQHLRSACNEKLTSHLYHFAIVPTLAWAEDDSCHYFIYPFMENGDLYTALDGKVIKSKVTLIRILLQVASAIEFLHTPVESYRGIIIHCNITTKNILLDEVFNARLSDFGLCRDLKRTTTGTDGYYVPKEGEILTEKADYYNFGVVCWECLTGKAPEVNNLIDASPEKIKQYWMTFNESLTDEIYTQRDFDALASLSKLCLEEHSGNILQKVQEIFEASCPGVPKFTKQSKSSVCLLCMVNEAETDSAILKKERESKICKNMAVCIRCQQNSYVNPITCCDCLEEITSMIGKDWCALLIAGNENIKEKAKSFREDIEAVKAILLSKIPTIIGMNESRVELVTPNNPGTEEKMVDRVKEAFERLKDKKPKTFLFYYSGEKTESTQEKPGLLQLGSKRDTLPVEGHQGIDSDDNNTLQKLLASLNADRYFIFMDCCYPHEIKIKDKKVFQITPESNKKTKAGKHMSPFTEAFILGLTGRSCLFKCTSSGHCVACSNQNQSYDETFITVLRLFEFVKKHQQVPTLTIGCSVSLEDTIIAYYINKKEEYVFTLKRNDGASFEKKDIIPADFRSRPKDMTALKKILFNAYQNELKWKISEKSKTDFSDVIMISEVFGPKKNNSQELIGLKQLQEAFDANRTVEVELRPDDEIVNGKVAKFGCSDDILKFLKGLKYVEKMSDDVYQIKKEHLLDKYSSAADNGACRSLFEELCENQDIKSDDSVVFQFFKSEEEDVFICHIEKSE